MDIDKLIQMKKSYCTQNSFSSLMDIDKLILTDDDNYAT